MLQLLNFTGRSRIPLMLQTEAAECGLACLAMVGSFYGYKTDLPTLRRQHSVSMTGTTLNYLIGLADRLGLKSRPVKIELEDLDKLTLPAVLHWDFNHFVVLTDVKARSVTIHDPARGRRELTRAEASKHFTGVALELSPTAEFKRAEKRQRVSFRNCSGVWSGSNPRSRSCCCSRPHSRCSHWRRRSTRRS